jgi:hypothetical protein
VSDAPISINWLRWNPLIRVRIPLKFINADQSTDLRRGCFLMRINRYVECLCATEPPPHITVDLAGAEKGQVIRLSNVVSKCLSQAYILPYSCLCKCLYMPLHTLRFIPRGQPLSSVTLTPPYYVII